MANCTGILECHRELLAMFSGVSNLLIWPNLMQSISRVQSNYECGQCGCLSHMTNRWHSYKLSSSCQMLMGMRSSRTFVFVLLLFICCCQYWSHQSSRDSNGKSYMQRLKKKKSSREQIIFKRLFDIINIMGWLHKRFRLVLKVSQLIFYLRLFKFSYRKMWISLSWI